MFFFFFNDTATTEIYTLSLHDALPISPAIRRAVRSGPEYAATAATPGVGSTPNAGGATRTLKTKQLSRIFAQNLVLLPSGKVLPLADAGDRVRKLRVEVRIIARHEDAVLAELPDWPLEIGLVRLAGDPAVAPDVFRGRLLQHARNLREILGPLPVVVHAVHPVQDPLGAAFEEHDLETGEFLEHATQHQRHQGRAAVGRAPEHMCLVEIVEAVDELAVAVRVAKERHAELLGR